MTLVAPPTPRWFKMKRADEIVRLYNSPALHRIVAAGRRSYKTEFAKRCNIDGDTHHKGAMQSINGRFGVGAPTRPQVKDVWWQDLKDLSKPFLAKPPNETDLILTFRTGSTIQLFGLDEPQRIEGRLFDGFTMDECQECKPSAWSNSIYPTLTNTDRPEGWSLRIGRPKGRNHFFEWWRKAKTLPNHDAFTWHSSLVLPREFIEAAERNLDPLSFRREYEASWDVAEGLAYYAWNRDRHVQPLQYDPSAPLVFCFDFNRNPGVAVIAQEQACGSRPCQCGFPGSKSGELCRGCGVRVPPVTVTAVIGQVRVMNSNTPEVCAKLVNNWKHHEGQVHIYGDATGGQGGSAQTEGTNWELVRQYLSPHFLNMHWYVARSNPSEIDRVANTNARLMSAAGDVRLLVDEAKAPDVVRDFEGVLVKEGGSGEIDKNRTPLLSHLSDAIGYYLWEAFRLQSQTLYVS